MTTLQLHDLSQLGMICIYGEEAQSFLHSQLSCDVNDVTPGKSVYGSYCTPKGRILATFLLWRSAQSFYMQLPSLLREPIQKRLSKFILRSKVKASDATHAYARFGVSGDQAHDLLKRVFGDAPLAVQEVMHTEDATLIKLPTDRFEVVVSTEKSAAIMDRLWQRSTQANPQAWDWLDIRAGIPLITPATQEEFVPQMVNLDLIGGVSFTKGCYPGQEIVARMHHLGRLKQRMYLANIAGASAPQAGDKLYSADLGEQSCGTIVNAAPSPEGGYDMLAAIQTRSVEGGGVRWKALDGPALRLLPLPYKFY